jgi:hypothetical protein
MLALTQFAEVDRAMDNLVKSGKFYAGGPRPMGATRPGMDYGEYLSGNYASTRPHAHRHQVLACMAVVTP